MRDETATTRQGEHRTHKPEVRSREPGWWYVRQAAAILDRHHGV